MSLRQKLTLIFGAALFLLFGNIFLLHLDGRPDEAKKRDLASQIQKLAADGKQQAEHIDKLHQDIIKMQAIVNNRIVRKPTSNKNAKGDKDGVLPVLVFACNRPTVTTALDDLIKYRTSKEKFPIIVSQDCGHQETSNAIHKYKDDILLHIKQPDLSPIPNLDKKAKKLEGYYKVARHYKWGLGQIFDEMKYEAVIIMEDDLNISPDFYDYFETTYKLLKEDPTLYCVSAWNDNGKPNLISNDAELLYRSDFFPGLGWMMTKGLWDELRDKWPLGFWDDWLRQDGQRKGRACIRPEISRTHTFGAKGISLGQFWKTHLQFIVLNTVAVPWKTKDVSYLKKDNYDEKFHNEVFNSPVIDLSQLASASSKNEHKSVRIQYTDKRSFKIIAKALKLMDDFKDGVPRTAYSGVIAITYQGLRVYISPTPDWQKYDKSWT